MQAGFIVLVLANTALWAQSKVSTSKAQQAAADMSYVTCGEKPTASRTVRSDVFVSPDGHYRAYTEVEARALPAQKGESGPRCVNNSRLSVAKDASGFQIVFLEEASDTETGNSLRIVDWSADSRRLLMELSQWSYESPEITRTPVIYDAKRGVFQHSELNHAFSKQFGIECSLQVRVGGFSPEGKIVLETQPLTPEEEEVLAIPTCAKKKGAWLLSLASETLAPLPDTVKVQHNAKMEPQPGRP
jgi:hypothetical protein